MFIARGNRSAEIPNQLIGASAAFEYAVAATGQRIVVGRAAHSFEIRNRVVSGTERIVCRASDHIDRHAACRVFVADGVDAATTAVQRIVACSAFQYVAGKKLLSPVRWSSKAEPRKFSMLISVSLPAPSLRPLYAKINRHSGSRMGIIHRIAVDEVAIGVGEPVEDTAMCVAQECVAAEIDRRVVELIADHEIADRAVTDRVENGIEARSAYALSHSRSALF